MDNVVQSKLEPVEAEENSLNPADFEEDATRQLNNDQEIIKEEAMVNEPMEWNEEDMVMVLPASSCNPVEAEETLLKLAEVDTINFKAVKVEEIEIIPAEDAKKHPEGRQIRFKNPENEKILLKHAEIEQIRLKAGEAERLKHEETFCLPDSSSPVTVTPQSSSAKFNVAAFVKARRDRAMTGLMSPVQRPPDCPSGCSPRKRTRRTSRIPRVKHTYSVLNDSGSSDDEDVTNDNEEGEEIDQRVAPDFDFANAIAAARRLRSRIRGGVGDDSGEDINEDSIEDGSMEVGQAGEEYQGFVGKDVPEAFPEFANPDAALVWSADYTTFVSCPERYRRDPGPTFISQEPEELFMQVWDENIMSVIVRETNEYAWQVICELEQRKRLPEYLKVWKEVSVREMYQYFAINILMAECIRRKVSDYWSTDVMGMKDFRSLMSRTRFLLITRFLHFADNRSICRPSTRYEKKILKVRPIIDHCNEKFQTLYVPQQQITIDESPLLWQGLKFKQAIRSKAARIGIKNYELCESATGYLVKVIIKDSSLGPITDFEPTKVVLELLDGHLGVGHRLYLDNWHNQIPLSRLLKEQGTDVVGTVNRHSHGLPEVIRNLDEQALLRGDRIARHCGDVSVVSWRDVKLVTTVSTCHQNEMAPCMRGKQETSIPLSVNDYNQYMGGVALKDQKLSAFPMERVRGRKWYMKVFKRLLNTSLLNIYIIYLRNPMFRVLSHRAFRLQVAKRLLARFGIEARPDSPVPIVKQIRLDRSVVHVPGNVEAVTPAGAEPKDRHRFKRKLCVRCSAAKIRRLVHTTCATCGVSLCLTQNNCWLEWHSLVTL